MKYLHMFQLLMIGILLSILGCSETTTTVPPLPPPIEPEVGERQNSPITVKSYPGFALVTQGYYDSGIQGRFIIYSYDDAGNYDFVTSYNYKFYSDDAHGSILGLGNFSGSLVSTPLSLYSAVGSFDKNIVFRSVNDENSHVHFTVVQNRSDNSGNPVYHELDPFLWFPNIHATREDHLLPGNVLCSPPDYKPIDHQGDQFVALPFWKYSSLPNVQDPDSICTQNVRIFNEKAGMFQTVAPVYDGGPILSGNTSQVPCPSIPEDRYWNKGTRPLTEDQSQTCPYNASNNHPGIDLSRQVFVNLFESPTASVLDVSWRFEGTQTAIGTPTP